MGLPGQSGRRVQIIKNGYPLGQFYLLDYAGKDENGVSQFRNPEDGGISIENRTDANQIIIEGAHAQPKFLYSFISTFVWKNLDFNFLLRGVSGNEILNATLANLNRPAEATAYNQPRFTLNESVNDVNSVQISTRYLEKGAYLRLDNITLGYTIPWKNLYTRRLRVYVTGQNLFTITDYSGIDPEINLGGLTPGIDNRNYYPKTRSFLLGASLEF